MSNVTEVLNNLNDYNKVHNSILDSIADQLKEITVQFNSGEISADEYNELLLDIQSMNIIAEGAAELNAQKQLNTIINTAITIASTAAKAM